MPSDDFEFVDEATAAKALGVSKRTLGRYRQAGIGPRFTRIGPRLIVYQKRELREYTERRSYSSAAQEAATNAPRPGA